MADIVSLPLTREVAPKATEGEIFYLNISTKPNLFAVCAACLIFTRSEFYRKHSNAHSTRYNPRPEAYRPCW